MALPKQPDLDDATVQIARRMLNTPPKPHDEMKLGKRKGRRKKSVKRRASSASAKTAAPSA